MSLLVICPSRGRPDKAKEMLRTFEETKASDDTEIIFVLHESDPLYEKYGPLQAAKTTYEDAVTLSLKLNRASEEYADSFDYLHFVADDVRYKTPGWDLVMTETMKANNFGFGYASDGHKNVQGNHIMVDSRVVRALGWFALPSLDHLYIDNAWNTLGELSESIVFFPEVLMEHLHPFYGKSGADDSYADTNSKDQFDKDGAAFQEWAKTKMSDDVETVKRSLQ